MILSLLLAASAFAAPADFLSDLELFKQRSLAIRTNREALSAAGASTTSRLLQFTPKIVLAGGRERDKLDAPPTLYPYDNQYWYWRSGVDWNLFKGGGDYLAWRAARGNETSAGFAVASQELRTELDGANVIFRRLYLRDSAGAQTELLKLKQETLRIGRDRYQQGKIPLQDVMKMEVDLSQQVNVVRQSEIDLAENEAAYRSFFVDELKTGQWPLTGNEAAGPGLRAGKSFEQERLREAADALHFTWQSALTRGSRPSRATSLPSTFPCPTRITSLMDKTTKCGRGFSSSRYRYGLASRSPRHRRKLTPMPFEPMTKHSRTPATRSFAAVSSTIK